MTAAVKLSPFLIRKLADQFVNNNNALQNDTHLKNDVLANEVWLIEARVLFTASAVADMQVDWTIPAAATMRYGQGDAAVAGFLHSFACTFLGGGLASPRVAIMRALYQGGVNAGTIQLRWAQKNLEVSDLTVYENSTLHFRRIP